ncbi:TPA: hypothetical protein HA265_01985, partial [Candidatus Woesearchaeota archaeon]|nr:hypothetical protein [Candidatus Woesearchaeota archaeon]
MNRLKPNDTIYVLSYTHYERKSNAQEGGNVVMGLYSTMENAEEAAHIRRYEREYEIGEVKQILPVDITPIKVKKLLELSVKYAEKKIERFDAP